MSNFLILDKETLLELRGILSGRSFTESAILEKLGVPDFPSLKGSDQAILLKRTSIETPLDTLIRLFLIDAPCSIESARRAFEPMEIEPLIEAGILAEARDGSVEAGIKILPHRGLFIAFDRPDLLFSEKKEEYVMGIGSSTLTLAGLTVRRHSQASLDLGCGCGYHALLAASHSDRVYASDINERALKFTRFNASLNGFDNIECINGSLFEPFSGMKFDLVISNPPFVISPEKRYIYRDGGMSGDELCREIARLAPEYLSENGYLQMLCNWAEYQGIDWREPLSVWMAGSGCDAWVMRSESRNAETYASTWIKHTEKGDTEGFAKRFEDWTDYYRQLGIVSIGAGVINMRRRQTGKNWLRADDAPEKMLGPCGKYVEQLFNAFDFLFELEDDAMLETCFTLSSDARIERVCIPTPEGWADESIRLTLSKGLVYSGGIDPVMSNMLISCDGKRKLGEMLDEASSAVGVPATTLQHGFCNMIREMVAKGFLFIST